MGELRERCLVHIMSWLTILEVAFTASLTQRVPVARLSMRGFKVTAEEQRLLGAGFVRRQYEAPCRFEWDRCVS